MRWFYEMRDSNNGVVETGQENWMLQVLCQVAELEQWEPDKIPKSRLGQTPAEILFLTSEKSNK